MNNTSTPVMQPLMEVIENSPKKWPCVPSEYENLKGYYSKHHNDSLEGYDDWFNAHFRVLTPEEIELRKERIEKRKTVLKEIQELKKELIKLEKEESEINIRLRSLRKYSDNLLALINFEVEE